MKKVVVFFAAMLLTAGIYAQDSTSRKPEKTEQNDKSQRDCVVMKDGKMMVLKAGKWANLKKNITLDNGTVISSDGSVKLKTGESTTLKEGQGFYMDGKMKS